IDLLDGERGSDQFIAEEFEIRGIEPGEFRANVVAGEEASQSQADLNPLDPVVANYFSDINLYTAVAAALGNPVTVSYQGTPLVRESITASEMASLRSLDLNNRGITDLHGLDFAMNLKTLSISGNLVSSLTAIIPHTITQGDAVGAPV